MTMKGRKEMSQHDVDKAPVVFHDVVAYFSEKEWKLMHEWQKNLYKNAMKEIHQALTSLGYQIINPDTLVRMSKSEEVYTWDLEHTVKSGEINDTASSFHPAGTCPDIFLRVRKEEQPYCRDGHALEQSTISDDPSKASHPAGTRPDSFLRVRKEEQPCCRDGHALEQSTTSDDPSKDGAVASTDVLFRTKSGETVNLKDPQEKKERESNACLSTGLPFIKNECFLKKEEESSACLTDHHGAEDGESSFSPSSGYEVVSFIIKDEEGPYSLDSQDSKRRQRVNRPAGIGAMGRKMKNEISLKSTEKTTMQKASSGKAKVKELQSSEKGMPSRSQQWYGSIQDLGGEKTAPFESGFSNPTHSHLHPGSTIEAADKYYECVGNLRNANHLTCEPITQLNWKPYSCTECQKNFHQKRGLRRHQRTHAGARPYPCTSCKKSFIRKEHLIRHQRKHTGDRPFQCMECDKSFIQKAHLITHQRTHTGERPYQCTECEKTFNLKGTLMTHQRTHMNH